MRSKAWFAAPVLLAYAEVTKNIIFSSMGPKLWYPTVDHLQNLLACFVFSTRVFLLLRTLLQKTGGRVIVMGSAEMFSDDWLSKEQNARVQVR